MEFSPTSKEPLIPTQHLSSLRDPHSRRPGGFSCRSSGSRAMRSRLAWVSTPVRLRFNRRIGT